MNPIPLSASRVWFRGLLLGAGILLAACGTPAEVAQLPTLQAPPVPTRAPHTLVAQVATGVSLAITETATNTSQQTDEATTPAATTPEATTPEITALAATETATTPIAAATETLSLATALIVIDTLTQTMVPPTATLTATSTDTLTQTPVPPTPTLTATSSATPTQTPVPPSATPLPTDTATRIPATATATQPPPTPTLLPPTQRPTTVPPTALPTDSASLVGAVYEDSTSLATFSFDQTLSGNARATGTIDNDHPLVLFAYTGEAGSAIDIELSQRTGNLDPFLMILNPKGSEIARGNALSGSLNSALRHVPLLESGEYIIVTTRRDAMFGSSEGDFDLAIKASAENSDPFGNFAQLIAYDEEISGTLGTDVTEQFYTFRGLAGDTITIEMDAVSGDLDTILYLSDNLGNTLAYTDDDVQIDGTLSDSTIASYTLTKSGYYSITATQYLGATTQGNYALRVSQTGSASAPYPLYAPLVVENSQSLSSRDGLYSNLTAGYSSDVDGNPISLQTLLTYYLPPLQDGLTISSASFNLGSCYQLGGGFAALGDLSIYQDRYGRLSERRNIQRLFAGASLLGTQNDCSPLDVTSAVVAAYGENQRYFQLRLGFRDVPANSQSGRIAFNPQLLLLPGS